MSDSFLIAKVFHSGILELSTIITHNLLYSPLGIKEESLRKSCEVINNDKTILFLADRHNVDWTKQVLVK